jgi:hypothetical protein
MRGDELGALLGLPFTSARIRAVEQELGVKPDIDDEHRGETWYRFSAAGMVIVVEDRGGRIEAIFVDPPGGSSPLGYRGELPMGLLFSMRQGEIKAHLGPPLLERRRGEMRFDSWACEGYTLNVHYRPDGSIAFIALLLDEPPTP